MHRHEARVAWSRGDAVFTDSRYSRGHEWSFDGGVRVPASSSPAVVRIPWSVAEAVDPEEALVAAASACHMLFFLSFAAKEKLVVDAYVDDAYGVMEKNAQGKVAFSKITLRPRIEFAPGAAPDAARLEALHHAAHEACYIANSLTCEVAIEAPGAA